MSRRMFFSAIASLAFVPSLRPRGSIPWKDVEALSKEDWRYLLWACTKPPDGMSFSDAIKLSPDQLGVIQERWYPPAS